jgi:predicted small integral membrane protein
MALRVSKAVLVFAIALFYTILVLNNITDYGSNYEFVRHVLMMDSTLPGNHLMWRAVNSPLVHTVFYIGIIAWESVTMLLCWWAGVRLLKSYRADRAQFAAALNLAMIALTTSLLMLVGRIPRCRRRMVSDVAVENMEWAGRSIPNVYHYRCGVLGCGATRANSRLVGNPSFGGITSRLPASCGSREPSGTNSRS